MKYPYSIEVVGKSGRRYAFRVYLHPEYLDLYREEGLNIDGPILNTIPAWAVGLGLTRTWFFTQDVFNFRNPFRKE